MALKSVTRRRTSVAVSPFAQGDDVVAAIIALAHQRQNSPRRQCLKTRRLSPLPIHAIFSLPDLQIQIAADRSPPSRPRPANDVATEISAVQC